MKPSIQIWHAFSALLFGALLVWGMAVMGALGITPKSIPPFDFFLMALAVYRLTRLVVHDTITQFMRDWFTGAPHESFRGMMGTLVNCSWCAGLWFALLVPFAYFMTPYAWYPILVLALGGVGSFLQVSTNIFVSRRVHPSHLPGAAGDLSGSVCDVCGIASPPTHFS